MTTNDDLGRKLDTIIHVQKSALTEEKAERMMVRVARDISTQAVATHQANCMGPATAQAAAVKAQAAAEKAAENTGIISVLKRVRSSFAPGPRSNPRVPGWIKIAAAGISAAGIILAAVLGG